MPQALHCPAGQCFSPCRTLSGLVHGASVMPKGHFLRSWFSLRTKHASLRRTAGSSRRALHGRLLAPTLLEQLNSQRPASELS
ncbi:unnamed protein product [Ixodes persulcatus]